MSGVCYFIWLDNGEERYACVPRDEIRFVAVRNNHIVITLSTTGGHDMTIPYDGGNQDDDGLEDVGPWVENDRNLGATYGDVGQGARSFSHSECKDKMVEALTQSVDIDCTFRWNGTTWDYTESRPT